MLKDFSGCLKFRMKTLRCTCGNYRTGKWPVRMHRLVDPVNERTPLSPFLCSLYTHTHTISTGVKVSLLAGIFKLEERTTVWKVRLSLRFLVNSESQRQHQGGMGTRASGGLPIKCPASSSTVLTRHGNDSGNPTAPGDSKPQNYTRDQQEPLQASGFPVPRVLSEALQSAV